MLQQIYETLRDLYFIFQSKYFIPSQNSGLSRFIMMQIKKKENIFDLKSYLLFQLHKKFYIFYINI